MTSSVISVMFRVTLGAVMLVAGALKLPDPAASVRAVRAYQALPEAVVPLVGYALPIIEVLLGVLLITGLLTRAAALATGLLQVVFIAGIAAAWARGLEIDCGCFGGGGVTEGASAKYPFDIARDVAFAAMAWFVFRVSGFWGLDGLLFPSYPRTTTDAADTDRIEQETPA